MMFLCKPLRFLLLAVGLILSSCGYEEFGEQKLRVIMYGVNQSSTGVTGSAAPRALTVTLNTVTITDADGVDKELGASLAYKTNVINRQQILYEKDVADLEGNTYASATLSFASDATVVGKYNDLTLTLPDDVSEMVISDSFTVQTGQGVTIYVKVKWDNYLTIDDDAGQDLVDADVDLEFDTSIEIE